MYSPRLPILICVQVPWAAPATALFSRASGGHLAEGTSRVAERPGDPAPGGTWQRGRERLHQLDASGVSEVSACTCGEAAWKTVGKENTGQDKTACVLRITV